MKRLVAIVGPTGTGKSRLALRLARQFNGEIVSADSRQVYRHLDIGTAKPSPQELSAVPHHLVDIIEPGEDFSLGRYQQLAFQAIDDVLLRGRLPFLVGGTGQYVWAVLEGWQIPRVPPDAGFRRRLEAEAAEKGSRALYERLMEADPAAARRIDPRNLRRVIRALEVARGLAGRDSPGRGKRPPPYDALIIGLTMPRQELYRRTDARVDDMMERGLVEEVRGLWARGYGPELPSMSGIGYRQIGMYLRGELSLAEAVRRTKLETHRLVRQQYAWFRPDDARIRWFDACQDPEPKIATLLSASEYTRGQS